MHAAVQEAIKDVHAANERRSRRSVLESFKQRRGEAKKALMMKRVSVINTLKGLVINLNRLAFV
jgi:hypothetical protein